MIKVEKRSGKILVSQDKGEKFSLEKEIEKLKKERISLVLELREIQRTIRDWTKIKENFWLNWAKEKKEKEKEIEKLGIEINFLINQKNEIEKEIKIKRLEIERDKSLLFALEEKIKSFEKTIKEKQKRIESLSNLVKEKEKLRKEINELLSEKTFLEDKIKAEREQREIELKEFEKVKILWAKWQEEISKLQLWEENLTKREQKLKQESAKAIFKALSKKKVVFTKKLIT